MAREGKGIMNSSASEFSPHFLIPVGSQVVLTRDEEARRGGEALVKKAGSVAEVVKQPLTNDYAYSIAFADGASAHVRRRYLAIRKHLSPESDAELREVRAYEKHLILRVAMGSRVYGLATEDSDTDEKGIFLPPASWQWSLHPLPEQVEFKSTREGVVFGSQARLDGDDHCWWELEKFLKLALRANPTVLEMLFVPEAQCTWVGSLGKELLDLRRSFLSQHLYQTYSGYALSQFRRMRRARESGREHRPKHAMHLVRLLYSGIAALRTGDIQVDVSEHRDQLLSIKRQELSFEEVHALALELGRDFQAAFSETRLPEKPDVAAVDSFLIRARRSMV